MTDTNYTDIDKELLKLCKEYIRVMNVTPAIFAEELIGSIVQVYEEHSHQAVETFEELGLKQLNSIPPS